MSSGDSADTASKLDRETRRVSTIISTSALVWNLISVSTLIVAAIVFFTSPLLSQDKKVFLCTVLGVCTVALQVVLCIARRDTSSLVFFTQLIAYISGVALGVSLSYT